MHIFAVAASGSEDEDENDNKSDKSDDDNEQDAKVKRQSRDGSLPLAEGPGPSQPESEEQQAEQQQQKKKKRQSRQDLDAEYEAKIAELPLRIEPVGLDRHYRKYWLLSGNNIRTVCNMMLPSGYATSQKLLSKETVGLSAHLCQCWLLVWHCL